LDFSWRFDRWFTALIPSPRDDGVIRRLVLRPPGGGTGSREIVESMRVSVERGIDGDRWFTDESDLPFHQVSLVNIHVLESLAGTDPERCALSGDNLQVDLDLTEPNLPVGAQLSIGSAVLEVSPLPHVPCGKFNDRYGVKAVKKVLRANKIGRRGRGVVCVVRTAGEFKVGDRIRVNRRPIER
jgi:hypothetical protein